MKKKLLSFILEICLLLPCSFALTACGNNPPDEPHTHNWSTTWSKNETEHWYACDGCDEKKDKGNHDGDVCSICGYDANHTHAWPETYQKDATHHWKECSTCGAESAKAEHDYENNICQYCGYENPDADLEMVSSVRDLEIITYDTGYEGVFTLVLLPDGKNMVIDSGATSDYYDFDIKMLVEDKLKYTHYISTIDYFVLTNTTALRAGQAEYILTDSLLGIEVKNLYTPREINDSASTCYKSALANTPATCNVVEVAESNCDILYEFKDGNGAIYSYKIDFMLSVATSDCAKDLDASIAISIEYAGKTVLISGDATEKNIDAYGSKYGGTKDVDVLITSFEASEPYAIVNSSNRPGYTGGYLASISLEEGDYAIISPISSGTNVGSLTDLLVDCCQNNLNVFLLTDESGLLTAYVTITSAGVVSVTAE